MNDFDFGFSSMSEEDIVLPVLHKNTHTSDMIKAKEMLAAIIPLLDNLAKDGNTNPYIHWPNRVEKIQKFKEKLDFILNS